MQEALQDVEYLTEQRVSVLHSLLAWHSAHTGNAALASEAEFEGLEAEVVRLQGRRSSGGHVLETGTLSEPGAFVALWTEHMGASASHLGGVHGKVRSHKSQTCMRHFYLADVHDYFPLPTYYRLRTACNLRRLAGGRLDARAHRTADGRRGGPPRDGRRVLVATQPEP